LGGRAEFRHLVRKTWAGRGFGFKDGLATGRLPDDRLPGFRALRGKTTGRTARRLVGTVWRPAGRRRGSGEPATQGASMPSDGTGRPTRPGWPPNRPGG